MGMRVFVTGGTGVIGRRVLPLLLAEGHSVTVALRGQGSGLPDTVATIRVGLFDPDGLRRALAGHDAVINLATHIPSASWKMLLTPYWRENDRIRTTGVRNLTDAARLNGISRFVQESFAPIYPDCGEAWVDESMPLKPASYNRSVLDAESSVRDFAVDGRIGTVLRFGALYGPDAVQMQTYIDGVKKGWAALPGDPRAFISSLSHGDAATAVLHALKAPSGPFNIVDDQPVRRAEFFGSLARAMHARPPRFPPRWVTLLLGPVGETVARSLRISNRAFRAATGWQPQYPSVREGWPATLAAIAAGGPGH
jgi:nucleoside-diphosphate-sugar epimerase